MKKNLTLIGILVLIALGMNIFAGCAENKTAVKDEAVQEQKAEAAQPAQTVTAPAPQEQTAKVAATTTATEAVISDINFDFDQSNIRPDAREILKANADILLKKGSAPITIEGYCDERGTAEYNMALGERRAQETKKYIINLGVKASQIKTISYGEERPLDSGHNEEAWAKNRRAHFVVDGK
jgi:peptidoglycan-associated lipoprotein